MPSVSSSIEFEETFDAVWKTLGPSAQNHDPATRIQPAQATADTAERRALDALAQLSELSTTDGLRLGETLGMGGMGIVRGATQLKLVREVAIKTLRDDVEAPDRAALSLLQEAWITGALEHPNIVPVHDVALDDRGRPRIILKKIEGTPWSTLLSEPERLRALDVADPLEWHLRTLLQVCNAIHFAHTRGIVHRDIKPSNVMVGAFGEIYVLDWGIAVATRDDRDGRLPLASDAKLMAGTPCYMAPEMLGGDTRPVDARTDVYLLGATLYRILAGHPPHQGRSMHALLREVLRSDPAPVADAPPTLLLATRRAMHPDMGQRFQDVPAFRAAIERFLEHRASERLAQEAAARLDTLLAALTEPEPDRQRVYDLLGGCRFGFREALRTWPENHAARDGMDRAVEAMVGYELDRGEVPAAEALLAELSTPSPALSERLRVARDAAAAESERVADLERQLDWDLGGRFRLWMLAFPVTLGVLGPFVEMWMEAQPGHDPSHGKNVARGIALVLFSVAAGLFLRKRVPPTVANRVGGATLLIGFTFVLALWIGAPYLDLGPREAQAVTLAVVAQSLGVLALGLGINLWPSVLVTCAAFALAVYNINWIYYSVAATHLAGFANFYVILAPGMRQRR